MPSGSGRDAEYPRHAAMMGEDTEPCASRNGSGCESVRFVPRWEYGRRENAEDNDAVATYGAQSLGVSAAAQPQAARC